MASYEFRYVLAGEPTARLDGSGCVDHDVYRQVSVDGGVYGNIDGKQVDISIPAADIEAALAEANNAAIYAAYKGAMSDSMGNDPEAEEGWADSDMTSMMEANELAEAQTTAIKAFISETLGLTYPVAFNL